MKNFQFNAFPGLTPAVRTLLFLNVIVFIFTWLVGQKGIELAQYLGYFYPGSPNFHAWQLVSYMFMHGSLQYGGLQHIFFNMFALYSFGTMLENVWGTERFTYFYFITGLGAIALQMGVQAWEVHQITGSLSSVQFIPGILEQTQLIKLYVINTVPTVGASGAIFGILVAFAVLFPNSELFMMFIPIPIKAKYFASGYILLELWLGFVHNPGDNIAHFAHLGGALFGFLLLKYWNSRNYKNFY